MPITFLTNKMDLIWFFHKFSQVSKMDMFLIFHKHILKTSCRRNIWNMPYALIILFNSPFMQCFKLGVQHVFVTSSRISAILRQIACTLETVKDLLWELGMKPLMHLQGCRKVWKSGGASSNVAGIILLVEIGLTDLPCTPRTPGDYRPYLHFANHNFFTTVK